MKDDFVKLGKMSGILTGYPFKGNLYKKNGKLRVVRGENVTEGKLRWDNTKFWNYSTQELNDYLLREGDIVVGMDGSKVGKNVAKIRKDDLPLILAQRVACIKANEKADQDFLYYLVNNPRFIKYVFLTQTGSSVPHISKKQIEDFPVPKLSLGTQQKIASVLSTLDDKIELNNQINAELEAMAKTLYDYWFVQFDFPTPPSSASDIVGKPYKSSGGKMVFDKQLKREIPEGWGVSNLYDIADFINGLACQKYRPKKNESFLPVVKIKEMKDGLSMKTEKVRYDIPEKYIINNGDILFSWSASLDVQIWAQGKAGLNQHIFKVKSETYPHSFLYFELLNYLDHFIMMANLRKTTMGHITINHLKTAKIVIPPKDIINQADKKLTSILEKQLNNKLQNQELVSLRDWLLPMLMNGQVTVGEAEKEVDQVLGNVAESRMEYGN